MGKCMSGISVDVYIPQEVPIEHKQIEMKIIEETSDIISIEDSIRSLDTEDLLDIDRVIDELLEDDIEIIEDELQSDIEDFIDKLLEENGKLN